MAQPLDPINPALPGRPPLRHRIPGQGSAGQQGDRSDAGRVPPEGGDATAADTDEAPASRPPEDSDSDDHLIDDYA